MQSIPYRVLLALAALALCWLVATLPIGGAWAGADDDDSADDDDDTADDDDDDTSGDDDDSSVGTTTGASLVPYDNRELGGGCACQFEGSSGTGGVVLSLLGMALLLRRRRSALAG